MPKQTIDKGYQDVVMFQLGMSTKVFTYAWRAFFVLWILAGITNLFYTHHELPNHVAIGITTMIAGIYGLVFTWYWFNPKLMGIIMGSTILTRPIARIARLFYGEPFPVADNLIYICLVTAFWILFMVLWFAFTEPFIAHRLNIPHD